MHVARKGKAVAGTTDSLPKHARWAEEMIILPPPPPQPIAEESTPLQPESSAMGASPSIPILESSTAVHASTESIPANMGLIPHGLPTFSAWH